MTTPTIADLLAAPLDPNWTVDGLAEHVLGAVADGPGDSDREFTFAVDPATDRQAGRLIRPLLACLATKSEGETGVPVNLYGGRLSFERPGPTGPVRVVGEFENRPGKVYVALRRSNFPAVAAQSAIRGEGETAFVQTLG